MTPLEQVLGHAARELQRAWQSQRLHEVQASQLQQRLAELAEDSRSPAGAPAEIEALRERLEESQAAYRRAAAEADRRERQHRELSRGLASPWRRLGILIRKCFRPRSPGFAALRERFVQLEDELQQAEDRRDYQAHVLHRQRRDLRRGEAAAARQAAIQQSLERQAGLAARRAAAARQSLAAGLRRAAGRIHPAALVARCGLQNPEAAAAAAVTELVELHHVLLQRAVLSAQLAVSRDPRSHEITLRALEEAARSGFTPREGSGSGTVHVSGTGACHVRRSRTRTESYRDAHGKRRTRRRRESYWQECPVGFAGELPVRFPVPGQGWAGDGLAETIWDEAGDWLEQGYRETRAGAAADELKRLQVRAEQLTERLLRRWELA